MQRPYVILSISIFVLFLGFVLSIENRRTYHIDYGVSFNQNHAVSLGLDWRQVYRAIFKELHPRYIRIAAMWSEIEPLPGEFDFSDVDWMMDEAAKRNTKVLLVVGQKAPRWPECHVPDWIDQYGNERVKEHLFTYIRMIVERYRDHPALEMWQVENEPFIRFTFGNCERYREDVVHEEIELVRELDTDHRILVTDSGELSTWRLAARAGDIFGTTLYRVVRTSSGRIFTYDWLPAIYYRLKSQFFGRTHEDFFVAELQAEPWFVLAGAERTPLEEQFETMSLERMRRHIEYVRHVGASRAYLWGVEWWYWLREVHDIREYWDLAREIL